MIFARRRVTRLLASNDYEGLVTLLEHGSRRERRAAAGALGKLGDVRAIEPLDVALQSAYGQDEGLPPLIVAALKELNDPKVPEALISLLADRRDDAFYFPAHLDTLYVLAERGVLEPLEAVVRDPTRDPLIQREAEALLRKHRSESGSSPGS
jgi:HEAT repeat protein